MHPRLNALVFACALALAPLGANAADTATPESTSTSLVPAPSVAAQTPQAALEALRDVPADSYAYESIQKLEADHLIQGYPDGTFKGKRPLTRYEAAVITRRVVAYVEDQLKNPATANTVSAEDVASLRKLLDEFKGDIDALQFHVAQIDDRLKTVEQTLDRQQFHVQYVLRAPGTFRDQVSAYNKGVPLAAGTVLAADSLLGSGEKIKRNTLVSGLNQTGDGYQILRFSYDGNVDPKIAYHVQVENQLFFDNASASTNSTFGGYSTSGAYPGLGVYSTSGATGTPYPNNTTFRINYANVVYKDPSGFSLTAGRYRDENSGLGLNYNDYFNGALLAYERKAFSAQVGYSFNYAALSNGVPGNASYGNSGQTLLASANYRLGKKAAVGATYASDLAANETLWNPAVGYQTSDVPISVGSIYGKYAPSGRLLFEAEGLKRFGKDPFTGNNWQQSDALFVQGKYGAYDGVANGSYLEAGLFQAGFNSLSGHTAIASTLSYYPEFITNPDGYRSGFLGVHHWLTKNARIGLLYLHYNLIPGTDMPVQTSSGACAKNTCYVGRDNASALFLQSWVQF